MLYSYIQLTKEDSVMAKRRMSEMDEIVASHEKVAREVRGGGVRGPDGKFMSNEMGLLCTTDDELPARNGHVPHTEVGHGEAPVFRHFTEYDKDDIRSFLSNPDIPADEKAWFRSQHGLLN